MSEPILAIVDVDGERRLTNPAQRAAIARRQAPADALAYSRHWNRARQCDCTRCKRHIDRTITP